MWSFTWCGPPGPQLRAQRGVNCVWVARTESHAKKQRRKEDRDGRIVAAGSWCSLGYVVWSFTWCGPPGPQTRAQRGVNCAWVARGLRGLRPRRTAPRLRGLRPRRTAPRLRGLRAKRAHTTRGLTPLEYSLHKCAMPAGLVCWNSLNSRFTVLQRYAKEKELRSSSPAL